jgi:uncharacterized cupin superfamily protein
LRGVRSPTPPLSYNQGLSFPFESLMKQRLFKLSPWVASALGLGWIGSTVAQALRVHVAAPAEVSKSAAPLTELQIDPTWVLTGSPKFLARVYSESPDGRMASGIWECQGPGKFKWDFKTDESVYILEGEVHVTHQGNLHTLRPGDTAFFPAGTVAVWDVPSRVRKSFTLTEPGRLVRAARKLLRARD